MNQMPLKEIEKTVCKRLRSARLSRGRSQQEVAKVLGVTFQQIQKYETGANRISAGKLFLIAKFLKMPITDFFGTKDDFGPANNDTQRLLRMFNAIESPALRKNVIELCRHIEEIEKRSEREVSQSGPED
ncbi:MAG: XRE family transcriptional regulator [Alphaproteobacteria bacterium]|nr:XRE family transcriptional regulator [Alphaproteobacteria bacterium]